MGATPEIGIGAGAEQAEALYRATFDHAGVGIAHVAPDGRWLRLNDAVCEITGYSREALRELTFGDITHPDDLIADRTQAARLAAGEITSYRMDKRYVRPDSSVVWVHMTVSSMCDAHGKFLHFISIIEDISARKRVEDMLRESEALFHALANNIPTLCWMADAAGSLFWYNSRWYAYTGTTPEQMAGWGWQAVHDPSVLPTVMERWRTSLARGEPLEMVFPLKGADGLFRPFLTRVVPVRNTGGAITGWFGSNTDISQQQAAEQALRDTDRRKDEFLATLAHELRNPLGPIRNAAKLLRLEAPDAQTHQWAASVIERQVQNMAQLLEELLDVARITRGTLKLQKQRVTLAAVVDNALQSARPLLSAREHRLTVNTAPAPLLIDADPQRLAQVIANLLTNAAKYTEPGGYIELAERTDGEFAVLSVRDSGVGLEPTRLSGVFEPFSQVKSALDRSEGGLGVGLALVKGVIELHGGSVEARSAGLGRGSEFIVRLPLPAASVQAAPVIAGAQGRTDSRSLSRRILIADDNPDALQSLRLLLELDGHSVHVAKDGAEALALAETLRPEVAVLDIGMPQLNGYEVARAIRALDGGQGIALIALTGWGQEEDKRRAHAAGFDEHMTKPLDPERLQALLRPREPTRTSV